MLQICFGVGNSLSAVLQHPVEMVDAVELSPGVLEAAPFFSKTNRDSMIDPRVEMIINDGRNFLLTSDERYDVIRLDPPELHTIAGRLPGGYVAPSRSLPVGYVAQVVFR